MDRPILVVGYPRSGTSLLRDLLRAHSRITIPQEVHPLPALWRLHGDPGDRRAALRLADDLLGVNPIRHWGLGLRPEDLADHRTFAAMVSDIYAAWARLQGKPRWGNKTPDFVAELPTVMPIFPGAQVLHIIRDPRAVAASVMSKPWGPSSVRMIAAQWRQSVTAGRRDGAALGPDSYRELRYEELTADPARVVREVCDFLGEQFEPEMLTPSRHPVRRGQPPPWRPDQFDKVVPAEPADQALERSDQAIVAWEAGELMEHLGYGPVIAGRAPFPGEYKLRRAGTRAAWVRLRLTAWDRRDRNRDTLLLWRARLRAPSARRLSRAARA
jgi:hypothetical protein